MLAIEKCSVFCRNCIVIAGLFPDHEKKHGLDPKDRSRLEDLAIQDKPGARGR
jgi:hypothetical protein